MAIETLIYLGDTLVADVNKFAKNRHLSEGLKSEQETATTDTFIFDINWQKFRELVALRFDDDPATFLRVGKTRVVYVIDGRVRFAGWMATKPARSGLGSEQTLNLVFYEYFARLSGDLVVDPNNKMSPVRTFESRPAHLYVQDLVNEYMARAADAGEVLNWSWGTVTPMVDKTFRYVDFQTVSKALCDAMNNVSGHGKFDVVFRTDPEDYTHQFIDILKPRGRSKNIIVKYPSDGVYTLWSTDYEMEAANDYASEVLVSGNGQVGDPAAGENTAALGASENSEFVAEYCYWRSYSSQSNLVSQAAVQDYAEKLLVQRDFARQAPKITMVGRPIEWGNADNEDNGLAVGDAFYFQEDTDDGSDQSGWMRILGLETSWDDNGVARVNPLLQRIE